MANVQDHQNYKFFLSARIMQLEKAKATLDVSRRSDEATIINQKKRAG